MGQYRHSLHKVAQLAEKLAEKLALVGYMDHQKQAKKRSRLEHYIRRSRGRQGYSI